MPASSIKPAVVRLFLVELTVPRERPEIAAISLCVAELSFVKALRTANSFLLKVMETPCVQNMQ